jgi:hypothetical protein
VSPELGKGLAQRRIFGLRLLYPILAEDAMAGGKRVAHAR